MYEVWLSSASENSSPGEGLPGHFQARFDDLTQAYKYVGRNLSLGDFVIKNPDGSWFQVVFLPR